jgi:peptidyl-prolyl cis-trans isomerase D
MLKFFRKHARGWFMLLFMAIIILVFVFYFGTDRGSQRTSAVAIIDGRVISEGQYYNEYSKMMDIVKDRYGGALTADMLKQMDLKKMAYDSLMNRQIIISKARDFKIQVSDDEVRQSIMLIPALLTDGRFDQGKYNQFLRFNKMTAEDFEMGQKVSLAATKIESIIREGIKVSDQEAFDLYLLQSQKINLHFVKISGAALAQRVAASQNDLEDYLRENASAFRVPEQFKVKYLYFPGAAYAPADISTADIRDVYNRHKDSYKGKDGQSLSLEQAASAIARQIKQNQGMQNALAEAKKAHDTIYQEENFDTYAQDHNLQPRTTGFFPVNAPPQPLAGLKDLALQLAGMEKNETTRVLGTEAGYYIIRVEDKKAAYTPALKEIENEVRHQYLQAQLDKNAAAEADSMFEQLRGGESIEKLARQKGLAVQETGFFLPGNVIPKIGDHPDAMEELLSLSSSRPYPEKPLAAGDAYVIFKLKDITAPELDDFEIKKEVYRKVAANLKRDEVVKSWLEGNKEQMIREKRLKINKRAEDL